MQRTEQALENDFIKTLQTLNYEYASYVKNEESMKENFKKQLSLLNKFDFTREHFESIFLYLESGSIFDKAIKLRDAFDIKLEDGSIKTIIFLDQKDWCRNIFQVTNQFRSVLDNANNRYDVTILVNGLPLVHIELKKSSVSIYEALGQISRYKKDTMDRSIFYQFVQIFIISNGKSTKYVANNKTINPLFAFKFVDFENNPINDLENFTLHFLEKCSLGKYLSKYIILSSDTRHQTLMLMRPYQVNAVEGILNKLDNKANGFVWHTTGSGKTLTSFKACEIISERPDIDKVIFIVDRIDLDRQTVSEYQKFKKESANGVTAVANVRELKSQLKNPDVKIIVTTIQKLEKIEESDRIGEEINVVLVFDECHRGQLGPMHQKIVKFFNNPCKYGFTGTPIFPENSSSIYGDLQTTQSLFTNLIHSYTIANAIDDKNVLGFKVDYKDIISEKTNTKDGDTLGTTIDLQEVYSSDGYVDCLVNDILETYDFLTINRSYNAMLACDGIAAAIRYYNYFKNSEKSDLKIACVFSVSENQLLENETMSSSKRAIVQIMNDYNKTYGLEGEDLNYDYSTIKEYRANVEKRMKDREIDLLIVSDMFLTGFDAKKLNTLYLDKQQKYHTLIQTISRTNRIDSSQKNNGNIVFYRSMKENVEEALKLFSDNQPIENIVFKPFDQQLKALNDAIDELKEMYPDIDTIENLRGDIAKKDFILKMRNVNRELNAAQQYRDFTYDLINLDKQSIEEFKVKYQEIYNKVIVSADPKKISILGDINFEINLLESVVVNYDYIKHYLLDGLDNMDHDSPEYENEVKKVLEIVSKTPNLKSKLVLIEEFLEKYSGVNTITDDFDNFIENKNKKLIEDFCTENDLDVEKMFLIRDQYIRGKTLAQLGDDIRSTFVISIGTFSEKSLAKKQKIALIEGFLFSYKLDICGEE